MHHDVITASDTDHFTRGSFDWSSLSPRSRYEWKPVSKGTWDTRWSLRSHCTLHVRWLIWWIVSDVTVFFLTYRDPRGQADEPMTLKTFSVRGCESYALNEAERDPTTRLAHLTTRQMWTLHIQGDRRYEAIAWPLAPEILQLLSKYLILNVIFWKNGTQSWQLVFSSDSKLT